MQDPEKIKEVLEHLGPDWVEAQGKHALTKVDDSSGTPVFYPTTGAITKVFVNPKTGEMRTYLAENFEADS